MRRDGDMSRQYLGSILVISDRKGIISELKMAPSSWLIQLGLGNRELYRVNVWRKS